MICMAVTYVVRPGQEDAAIALFRQVTEASRREPGCRAYQVHRSADDARRFLLYEAWADEEALREHMNTDHFRKIAVEQLRPLTESHEAKRYTPIGEAG